MLIRTERLILREFRAEDWEEVLAYQRDPRYLRYHPWSERTPDYARAFVERFIRWQKESPRSRVQLCICLARTEQTIGNVGIRREEPEGLTADLGFELSPGHWGRGYATEAASAMLDFGFGEWKLHRIGAHCIAENVASARVLDNIGMRQEGRLRESQHFKGRWWDVLLFATLRSEWSAWNRDQKLR